MKKIMLLMMLAATLSANATTRVGGDDESNDLVLKKNDNSEWTMHLALGVNVPVSVEGDHKFAPFKSWNIMWTPFQYDYKPKGATQTYSAGVAISWHNYTLKDNGAMFTKKTGGNVVVEEFDTNVQNRWSSVHMFSINLPLLFTQSIGKKFSVTLGPVVNFNVYGALNNRFEQGDDDIDITTHDIDYRPVTVDILGVIDYDGFGVYCKYAPMTVFKKDRGPEFKSLTFGLYF